MRKFIPTLVALTLCFFQAQAAVIYVNLNAAGSSDGSSWANAFTDFKAAINAAAGGDSIFVATAVYQPASGTSFAMKEGVKIFGGFLGTESSFSQRSLSNKATLQGNGNSVIINDSNGLTASAVLDGFIITGGYGDGRGGGGIFNIHSSPTIRNCVFSNNEAAIGAGIYNYTYASPTIIDCIFTGNSASTGGGAIYNMAYSSPAIINSTFSGNTSGVGGAVYNGYESAAIITNCVISGNTAGFGGGMYNTSSNPVITNTIIWNNTGNADGNGIYNLSATPVITYSDLQDGVISGTGNISEDPLFTDMAGGDYSLKNTSPCIDAGNSAANSTATDLAGNTRIVSISIDIGAYELQGATVPVNIIRFRGSVQKGMASLQWESGTESNLNRYVIEKSRDGLSFAAVGSALLPKGNNSHYTFTLTQPEWAAYYRLKMIDDTGKSGYSNVIHLLQNQNVTISVYPNPARGYIHVDAKAKGRVYIYNPSGVLVKTETVQAGQNLIDIRSLSAGVYFIRMVGIEVKFMKP